MPQNTPMKRQFTTIDGRTVMSNLPQHWGGNDWKITGVDNPLPVGNYVQTEAGVWIPQKGSDDGAADVRLTGSIAEKEVVFERGIYNQSLQKSIDIPKRALGAMFHTRVRSLTGDVSSGGVSMDISLASNYPSVGYYYLFIIETEVRNTNTSFHTIIIQKNPDIGGVENNISTQEFVLGSINLSAFDQLRYRVNINGEDVEADVESFVKWLY